MITESASYDMSSVLLEWEQQEFWLASQKKPGRRPIIWMAHMPKIQGQSLVATTEISATIRYQICGEKHLQMRTILIQKVGLNHRKFLWCTMHMYVLPYCRTSGKVLSTIGWVDEQSSFPCLLKRQHNLRIHVFATFVFFLTTFAVWNMTHFINGHKFFST